MTPIVVSGVVIVMVAIGWLVWRATHCSKQGCGVQELSGGATNTQQEG